MDKLIYNGKEYINDMDISNQLNEYYYDMPKILSNKVKFNECLNRKFNDYLTNNHRDSI